MESGWAATGMGNPAQCIGTAGSSGRKLRLFTFNFLMLAAGATVAPFMVLYYEGLGFSGTQIGVLAGIVPLVTIVSVPLWTGFADATRRHKLVMSVSLLSAVLVLILFSLFDAFVPVLLLAVLLNFFVAPLTPLSDSATMHMLGDEKAMYGRMRLGGTLGYGLAAPVVGLLVQKHGLRVAFWACAALLALGWVASRRFTFAPSAAGEPDRGRAGTLLRRPRWLCFLCVAFAGGLAFAAVNTYLYPYMAGLGMSESMMGIALTVGVISEIPVLFFGNWLMKRVSPYPLLVMAVVASCVRMLLLAVGGTPGFVMISQLFNGLTFPVMWMAGVAYANENAPAGLGATAQGLLSAVVYGFGMAAGGFAGGPLLATLGGQGLYLVVSLIALSVALAGAWVYGRLPEAHPVWHS